MENHGFCSKIRSKFPGSGQTPTKNLGSPSQWTGFHIDNKGVCRQYAVYCIKIRVNSIFAIFSIQEFGGNSDRNTAVKHEITAPPITARFIRFKPLAWRIGIGMRVELYGCRLSWNAKNTYCHSNLKITGIDNISLTRNVQAVSENFDFISWLFSGAFFLSY